MHIEGKQIRGRSIAAVPNRQCSAFVASLFRPNDIIDIRALESWTEGGRTQSRVVEKFSLSSDELLSEQVQSVLQTLNSRKNANIYFGVNPRSAKGSNEVRTVRCLWADLDSVRPDAVLASLPFVLPAPSIVVNSGHGTHLYWKLSQPIDVAKPGAREDLEGMLRNIYAETGGDHVQDVSRILRLPGFWNKKNARNGSPPKPCILHRLTNVTHSLSDFEQWKQRGEVTNAFVSSDAFSVMCGPRDERTNKRIAGLMRYLDKDVNDRSKRDFSVVCGLLRLGVDEKEIASLVGAHSKFKGRKDYLITTIKNALKIASSL